MNKELLDKIKTGEIPFPLPSWDFSTAKIKAKTDNAIDRFINQQEPAGNVESKLFREQLSEVITFAMENKK